MCTFSTSYYVGPVNGQDPPGQDQGHVHHTTGGDINSWTGPFAVTHT